MAAHSAPPPPQKCAKYSKGGTRLTILYTFLRRGGGPFRECTKLTCLMKLYTSPPSIQILATWVPQSRLAFGHFAHRLAIGPPALAKPNPTVGSLACRCGPINSLFLLSPARCFVVRLYADSFELSYSYCILLHHLSVVHLDGQ